MRFDKTDYSSLVVSVSMHIFILLLLSYFIVQKQALRVALITDVTLIDAKQNTGLTGEEQKTMGTEKKQDKIATVIKKKTMKKNNTADVKSLLRKIEEQKAKLDMGISRDNLRQNTDDTEPANNSSSDDAGTDSSNEKALAGSAPAITGDIAARRYKKVDWRFPEKLPEETELMIEITVMPSGIIKNVKLARTSGYPELDRVAFSQVRKMQFDPLPAGAKEEEQLGVLLFKFGVQK
ncbi:MAG: TonB family protein [bacterium]